MPKKRVLIIDDELDFVKMLRARLQIEGYEVLEAGDGSKGVQLARREKPDLIILDIMMPGMDGHMVCDMLKKSTLTWSIPIIYLTAKTGQADEVLAMEKGAKHFLTKPYNPDMLLEMVRSAITENEASKKTGKILIIDKDLSVADELKTKLRQAGYEVALSPTPGEGLNAAREQAPDIIIFDIQTSRLDEHVSIRALERDQTLQSIPLFFLAPQSVVEKLDPKLGTLDKFIPKPVNAAALLEILARTLELKKF